MTGKPRPGVPNPSLSATNLGKNMQEKFPYEAPIVVVTEDMCDLNGHMNVAYYLQAFDIYSRPMFEEMGFTKEALSKWIFKLCC